MIRTNLWVVAAVAAVPTALAGYSSLCPVAQVSVGAEVVPVRPVANHPSVGAANLEIPMVELYLAVEVASDLAGPVATVVCPSQAVVFALVASGPAVAVDCCRPSMALKAECWTVQQ